jgi:hypothetical protein
MIKPTDMAYTSIQMVQCTKGAGRMTCSTAWVSRLGAMIPATPGSMTGVSSMGSANTNGMMGLFTPVSGPIIKFVELEFILGSMEGLIKESGKKTICMA